MERGVMTKPRYRWDWRCSWWYRSTKEAFEIWMAPNRFIRALRGKS